MLGSFVVLVFPGIFLAGLGYIQLLEKGLGLNRDAAPNSFGDQLFFLLIFLPMLPAMLLAILVAGIPWMFIMSRFLSAADIEHFSKQKSASIPWVSNWLDQLWLRMIASRH